MGLVIRFSPGESVKIRDTLFTVGQTPPSLMVVGQPSIPITDEWAAPLPGVRVRLASIQHPGYLALDFEAPREVAILRQALGELH